MIAAFSHREATRRQRRVSVRSPWQVHPWIRREVDLGRQDTGTLEGSGAGHGNSPDQAFGTSPSSGETSTDILPGPPQHAAPRILVQVPDSSRRRPVTRGPSCSIHHANTLASPPAETIHRIVRSPRHEYHICRASSYGKRRLTPPHSSCAASSTAAQGDHAEQVVHFIFIIFLGLTDTPFPQQNVENGKCPG